MGISGYQVKIIALILMTLDHLPVYINQFSLFSDHYNSFRLIGRISAPLFLYMFCESMRYTKDKRKFCLRLYLANLFTGLVRFTFDLFIPQFGMISLQNIFPTYMYTAIFILLFEKVKEEGPHISNYLKSSIALLVIVFLPSIITDISRKSRWFHHIFLSQDTFLLSPYYQLIEVIFPNILVVEYSIGFIILGFLWYFSKVKQTRLIIFFFFCIIVKYLSYFMEWPFLHLLGDPNQYFMIFAIPILLFYNGTRGKDRRWFFYAYYPFHTYVLQIINFLLV